MPERGQASVETIALMAVALALAGALTLGVMRLGPPLASTLGRALAGLVEPSSPRAPGLDGLERALLDGATSPEVNGPTLLDLRTRLRSRLERPAADAAFAASLDPLVARTLAANAIEEEAEDIVVVDRASEDAWVRERFHPGRLRRAAGFAFGLAGPPGAIYSLANDLGLLTDDPVDGIAAGHAAGDVIVRIDGGSRLIVLRRQPGQGLAVVADLRPGSGGAP